MEHAAKRRVTLKTNRVASNTQPTVADDE